MRIPASQAARLIGVQPHTLAVWRCKGRGPAYTRFGDLKRGRVYYDEESVKRFIGERTFTSTAGETLAAANAEAAAR